MGNPNPEAVPMNLWRSMEIESKITDNEESIRFDSTLRFKLDTDFVRLIENVQSRNQVASEFTTQVETLNPEETLQEYFKQSFNDPLFSFKDGYKDKIKEKFLKRSL